MLETMDESAPIPTRADSSGSGGSEEADTHVVAPPAGAGDGTDTAEIELEPGQNVGRYVVLKRIGAGGMGAVYQARDPELDRLVAVKVLQGDRAAASRERLAREAQALARLAHENVVTVYDVGTFASNLFIAMEFVEGRSLGAWLREAPRTHSEIVDAFVAAGRGLAAAHAVAIIHRDFKPDNVLVGHDGRVLVTDFGLARGVGPLSPGSSSVGTFDDGASDVNDALLENRLTQAGTVMGTPAYMAPEQHKGLATDPRADQYSFCISLFEALCGERPFKSRRLRPLMRDKMRGPTWPAQSAVSPRLRRIIDRGLSPDPEARWPNMQALLDELAPTTTGKVRWPWLVAGAGGLAAAAMAFIGDGPRSGSTCDAGSRVGEVWSPDRATTLQQRFASVSESSRQWSRTQMLIERYVEAWTRTHDAVCEAGGEPNDHAMLCLSERLHALETLLSVFDEADADVVTQSVSATSQLEPPAECARFDPLDGAAELPPESARAQKVLKVRRRTVTADVLDTAGKFEAALAEAKAAHEAALVIGWEPLLVETRTTLGGALERSGEYEAAAAELERACLDALALGQDEEAGEAATELVFVLGVHLGDDEGAQRWARQVEATLQRRGNPPQATARLRNAQGAAATHRGRYDEGIEHFEAALKLFEEGEGGPDPDVATALHNLAVAKVTFGRYREAEPLLRRALSVYEETVGTEHPDYGNALDLLGNVLFRLGRFEEATTTTRRALEIRRATLTANHPDIARSMTSLGSMYEAMGDDAQALAYYRRAVAGFERSLGNASELTAAARINMAAAMVRGGEYEQGRAEALAGMAVLESQLPATHPYFGHAFLALSAAELGLGNPREALVWATKATTLCEGDHLEPQICDLAGAARAEARHAAGDVRGTIATVRDVLGHLEEQGGGQSADAELLRRWLARNDPEKPLEPAPRSPRKGP
jgi:tetratricopeptide (TPR) repeat protein/predicted Ser/Thr protein kinase